MGEDEEGPLYRSSRISTTVHRSYPGKHWSIILREGLIYSVSSSNLKKIMKICLLSNITSEINQPVLEVCQNMNYNYILDISYIVVARKGVFEFYANKEDKIKEQKCENFPDTDIKEGFKVGMVFNFDKALLKNSDEVYYCPSLSEKTQAIALNVEKKQISEAVFLCDNIVAVLHPTDRKLEIVDVDQNKTLYSIIIGNEGFANGMCIEEFKRRSLVVNVCSHKLGSGESNWSRLSYYKVNFDTFGIPKLSITENSPLFLKGNFNNFYDMKMKEVQELNEDLILVASVHSNIRHPKNNAVRIFKINERNETIKEHFKNLKVDKKANKMMEIESYLG